ncbi:potassium channel family protein [Chloroflexota bacterium]
MYIIVVGGGRVGYYLTKALLDEGHEVLILEKKAFVCEAIEEELGCICFHGDGCEAANLEEVGTGRADMLIAVTGDDEDNLVACQVAKYKFSVPRTIARIRNPKNEIIFKKLGIDVTVSSTNIILEQIEEKMPTHPLTRLLAIEESGLEIVEVKINSESATIGKSVRQLSLPQGSKLALLIREKGKNRIPTINTVIRAGDRIIALTTPESEKALRASLTGT